MILLGFDPGINGAIAAIDHNAVLIGIRDLPTIELPGDGEIRRRLNGAELVREIRELVPAADAAVAYVEDVQTWGAGRPGGPAISQMAAMIGTKMVILAALDLFASRIRVELVQPATWKRMFGLKREKNETPAAFKSRSRNKALELHPEADIRKAKHDGRAEALLIAEWGRNHEGFRDDLLAEPRAPRPQLGDDIDSVFGQRTAA